MKKNPLIPTIETPQDDSELSIYSIGQLITERMKYKVKELNVIKTDDNTARPGNKCPTDSAGTTGEIKSLIYKIDYQPVMY